MLISNSIFLIPLCFLFYSCHSVSANRKWKTDRKRKLCIIQSFVFPLVSVFLHLPSDARHFLILSQFCYFYIFVKLTKVGVQMSRCCKKKSYSPHLETIFTKTEWIYSKWEFSSFILDGVFSTPPPQAWLTTKWTRNRNIQLFCLLFLRASMLQTSTVNFQNTDSILNIHPGTPLLHNMKEEDIWTLYHECILCRPNYHFVQWKSRFDVFLLEFSCACLQIWVKSISALIQTRALLNHRIKV